MKLQSRAAGKLATSDDVHVGSDVADAVLHVASTGLANNPGNIDTTVGNVASLKTLLVCVGVNETVRHCTLC